MKKGQFRYYFQHAFRLLFLIVAFAAVALLLEVYVTNQTQTQSISREIIFERLYYGDALWANMPEFDRPNIVVIDLTTIPGKNLDAEINFSSEQHIAVRVIIIRNNLAASIDTGTRHTEPADAILYRIINPEHYEKAKSDYNIPCYELASEGIIYRYINKDFFRKFCSSASLKGRGAATMESRLYPVSLITPTTQEPGTLMISVLTPNS